MGPQVHGRCPACSNRTLFLNDKGYLICSWARCENPGLLDDLVEGVGSVYVFDDEGHDVHDLSKSIITGLLDIGTVYEIWES